MSPFGGKKSVIFSQTESVVLGSDFKGKRMDGKEQSIEPWWKDRFGEVKWWFLISYWLTKKICKSKPYLISK